jgi:MOSC domain-containing protein YiiM
MSDKAGRIEALWVKRATRGVMDAVPAAELVAGEGVKGSADRRGKRQVTLIEREAWSAMMAELAADVPPAARRANVMLSGVRLADTRGRVLRLGTTRIRIAGETVPCERMEEACAGLRAAMRPAWRGGVFGEVITGGIISVGDTATWEEAS